MPLDLPAEHFDAIDTPWIESEIEAVQIASVEARTPSQDVRQFIPTNTQIGRNAEVFKYFVLDRVGSARIIAAESDDLPMVDVSMIERVGHIRKIGDAYKWNIFDDLQPAAQGRRSLPQERAATSRTAFDNLLKRIAMVGSTKHNLLGMLNQPNATLLPLDDGAGGAGWINKTPDEILIDLFAMEDAITSATNDEEKPDVLILPKASRDLLVRTRMGDTSETSLLEYYLETSEHIKTKAQVRTYSGLVGAGVGGVDRAVMYRNSPEVLSLVVPMDFTPLPPERRNLVFIVNNIGKTGGVILTRALGMVYGDGVDAT